MASSSDFAVLLGSSHVLRDGIRVRLRLARSSDAWAIGRLLAAGIDSGAEVAGGELTGLLHYDPRRRCVLCAGALIDGRETLVGVGSIDFEAPGEPCPDLLVVDTELADELSPLLTRALLSRVDAAARARGWAA